MKTVSPNREENGMIWFWMKELNWWLKTIEGRCAVGDYNRMASGAVILFNKCVASGSGDNNSIQTSYAFFLQFGFLITSSQQDFHRHASFFEMLEAGPWKVLPGVNTIAEGVRVYWKFYTEEKERSNGVLAICAAKSAAPSYISLATISSLWVFSLLGP